MTPVHQEVVMVSWTLPSFPLSPLPSPLSSVSRNVLCSLRKYLFGGERLLHIGLEVLRLRQARPPLDHLAVPADEELLKVPLDTLETHDAGLLLLQPLEDGLGLVAVDVDLAEHGEADAIVDEAELLDLVVGAGVLAAELVAGETQDGEVGVGGVHVLVELFEALELRGEAALGGGVDDEDHLALEGGERVLVALLWRQGSGVWAVHGQGGRTVFGLEVEEGGCGRHGCEGSAEVRCG